MADFIVCPGLDEAIVGTFSNDHDVLVPVYDINRVFDIFQRSNKSRDQATDWIADALESWSEQIRPIFINFQPDLGSRVKAQRAHMVN